MNKKIKLIISCIIVLITISVSIIISISKEKVLKSDTPVSGLAIYVYNNTTSNYVSQSSVPTGNYKLNKTLSHCVAKGKINSYDNTTGNISYSFGGSDRCYLYFEAGLETGVEAIIELASKDTTNLATDTHGTNNEYVNYRFVGANPNNYACFDDGNGGCINYNKDTETETIAQAGLFRIMGVFQEDTHGQTGTQLIKLISADFNIKQAWDSASTYGSVTYNWGNASLQIYFNETYYNNSLTSVQQNAIESVTWHLGVTDCSSDRTTSCEYDQRRGTNTYQDSIATWIGKIGLMELTDVAYATNEGFCEELYIKWWNYGGDLCIYNDWLVHPESRTGIQRTYADTTEGEFLMHTGYNIIRAWDMAPNGTSVYASNYDSRPSFYLKSGVYIVDGTGTSTDPYRFAL